MSETPKDGRCGRAETVLTRARPNTIAAELEEMKRDIALVAAAIEEWPDPQTQESLEAWRTRFRGRLDKLASKRPKPLTREDLDAWGGQFLEQVAQTARLEAAVARVEAAVAERVIQIKERPRDQWLRHSWDAVLRGTPTGVMFIAALLAGMAIMGFINIALEDRDAADAPQPGFAPPPTPPFLAPTAGDGKETR